MPLPLRQTRCHAGFRCCAGVLLSVCAVFGLAGCYSFPKPVVNAAPAGLNWLAQLVPSTAINQPVVNLELLRPAESAEVIHRGDLLELTVWDLYEPGRPQTAPLRVERDGKSTPPLLPALALDGLTLSEAEKIVAEQYQGAEILLQPRILVRRLETSQCPVQILGAVQRPGTVRLNRDQAVVYHALMAAGGLAPNAGHHIQLLRYAPVEQTSAEASIPEFLDEPTVPTEQKSAEEKSAVADQSAGEKSETDQAAEKRVATLDTSKLRPAIPSQERWFDLTNADECKELTRLMLQEGDQLTVREEAIPIRITGQVKHPGPYPLPAGRGLDILQALQLAGGPTVTDLPLQLTLTRPINGERNFDRKTFLLDPKHPQHNFPTAQPGDVLHLETTPRAKVERVVGGFRRRKPAAETTSKP